MAKNTKEEKIKKNLLIKQLEEDEKLDKETKLEYVTIAKMYVDKFDTYISKTSLDMDKEIPLGIDTWKEFLSYPIVRRYIQSFKDEQINQIADDGLMRGSKDAIGIKKVMKENGPAINNSNIVLIRLPEKLSFD